MISLHFTRMNNQRSFLSLKISYFITNGIFCHIYSSVSAAATALVINNRFKQRRVCLLCTLCTFCSSCIKQMRMLLNGFDFGWEYTQESKQHIARNTQQTARTYSFDWTSVSMHTYKHNRANYTYIISVSCKCFVAAVAVVHTIYSWKPELAVVFNALLFLLFAISTHSYQMPATLS